MNREDILDRVKAILEEHFSIAPARVTQDATFRGTLAMDSLDIVDFVFFLQQAFALKDTLQDYADLATVEQLVAYLKPE